LKRKAVKITCGTKYCFYCDTDFVEEFFEYIMRNPEHMKEIKIIFAQIKEGLSSKKYSTEPNGCVALKPFKNRQNDRIIAKKMKVRNSKQIIIMSELYEGKSSNKNDKSILTRYKIVGNYEYERI